MSGFVDECRREWKRLGVPEAVANEMAADLAADLDEAAAEGVSGEEVLGNGYFDPGRSRPVGRGARRDWGADSQTQTPAWSCPAAVIAGWPQYSSRPGGW